MNLFPIIHIGVSCPRPVALHMTGGPGSSKTTQCRDYAKHFNRNLEVVEGATMFDPSDILGYRIPSGDRTIALAPDYIHKIADTNAILAFDDFHVNEDIQKACYRVALERQAGAVSLGNDVRVIFLSNPSKFQGGVTLVDALVNRMVTIPVAYGSVEQWQAYRYNGSKPMLDSLKPLDMDMFKRERGVSESKILAFLSRRPELFKESPDKAAGQEIPSYATPRSWDYTIEYDGTAAALGLGEYRKTFMSGLVGIRASAEYFKWEEEVDLPDPADAINNPESVKLIKERPDRTFAITMSVASYALSQPTLLPKVWNFVNYVMKSGFKPHASRAAQHIINNWNVESNKKLPKDALDVLTKLRPLIM